MRQSVTIRRRQKKEKMRRDVIAFTIAGIAMFPLAFITAITPGCEPFVVFLEICLGIIYVSFGQYVSGVTKIL